MDFKTPQEAIAACEAEYERSWKEYLTVNKIDPTLAPKAVEAARTVFRAGYMAGARFVSGAIVSRMQMHSKPDKQP